MSKEKKLDVGSWYWVDKRHGWTNEVCRAKVLAVSGDDAIVRYRGLFGGTFRVKTSDIVAPVNQDSAAVLRFVGMG